MEDRDERIRRRAYEIWDHWYRAEREIAQGSREDSNATVETTSPPSAVRAKESVGATEVSEQETPKKPRRKRTP